MAERPFSFSVAILMVVAATVVSMSPVSATATTCEEAPNDNAEVCVVDGGTMDACTSELDARDADNPNGQFFVGVCVLLTDGNVTAACITTPFGLPDTSGIDCFSLSDATSPVPFLECVLTSPILACVSDLLEDAENLDPDDIDGDGHGNRVEVSFGSDPTDPCSTPDNTRRTSDDFDGDGYTNDEERSLGTNPFDPHDPDPRVDDNEACQDQMSGQLVS